MRHAGFHRKFLAASRQLPINRLNRGVRLLGDVSDSVWEAIFMLVILKIPLVYLGIVLWWAIRPVPGPPHGGEEAGVLAPLAPCGWNEWRRRRSPRPAPGPIRPVPRSTRTARARTA